MITIVDYGMGNLRNVRRACEAIGVEAVVTSDPATLAAAEQIILPGVGAFGEAVKRIEGLRLRAPISEHVASGRPLLGICLGMQLLFESSEESPGVRGLGILGGVVRKFDAGVKIPHIGWNDVQPVTASSLFPTGLSPAVFYFVHSFFVDPVPETIAVTEYGNTFASAVGRGKVFGVQFHPEKSQSAGLALLKHFASCTDRRGVA